MWKIIRKHPRLATVLGIGGAIALATKLLGLGKASGPQVTLPPINSLTGASSQSAVLSVKATSPATLNVNLPSLVTPGSSGAGVMNAYDLISLVVDGNGVDTFGVPQGMPIPVPLSKASGTIVAVYQLGSYTMTATVHYG